MPKLTNVEKFAIQGMLNTGITDPKVIAKEIGNTEKVVTKYIDDFCQSVARLQEHNVPTEAEKAAAAAIAEKEARSKGKNLMIMRTSDKNNKGVAVMTRAAAQIVDDQKNKAKPTRSRTSKGAIYNMETGEVE